MQHPLKFLLFFFTLLMISACALNQAAPGEAIPEVTPTAPVQPTPTSAEPTQALPAVPTPTATPEIDIDPQLVWFYKDPDDGNFARIAENFSMAILSYGDEPEREQFRSHNMPGPFLQYLRFEAILDPGNCTRDPWNNQVAYLPGDFCRISAEHPDWFMLDQKGQRMIAEYGGEEFVLMDPGHPGWRAFWLERAMQMQRDGGWDGVFLDNVEVTLAFRERRNKIPQNYPTEASYQEAVQGFLKYMYVNYFQPSGQLLYANVVSRKDDTEFTSFITYLDGAMVEGWAIDWPNGYRSASTWEKHMRLAEDTQAMGKTILLISQGLPEQVELQTFAYASYLLVNQGRAYFRFANSKYYREGWLYPNYELELGQPLGSRYQTENGWRRDFKNGWVEVDPTQHMVRIELTTSAAADVMTGASP